MKIVSTLIIFCHSTPTIFRALALSISLTYLVFSFLSSSSFRHRENSIRWTHLARFVGLFDRSCFLSPSLFLRCCCCWILMIPVELLLLRGFSSAVVFPFPILPHHSQLKIFSSFGHFTFLFILLFSSSCFSFEWKGPHSLLSFLSSISPLTRFSRTSNVFSPDLPVSVFCYVTVKLSLMDWDRVTREPFCHYVSRGGSHDRRYESASHTKTSDHADRLSLHEENRVWNFQKPMALSDSLTETSHIWAPLLRYCRARPNVTEFHFFEFRSWYLLYWRGFSVGTQ